MNTHKVIEAKSNLQSLFDTAADKLRAGKLDEAEAIYKQILDIQSQYPAEDLLAHKYKYVVFNKLGNVFQQGGKLDEAVKSYQQAISLKPDFAEAYRNLGTVLKKQVKLEEAFVAYQQAINLQPDSGEAKFGMLMAQLPIIYSSDGEIELRRNNYRQQLQNLAEYYQAADRSARAKAADGVGSFQPFYLAYQGLNDRDLQQTYGTMISQLMASRYPQWSQPLTLPQLKAEEKVRVGFVSRYFCKHSVWKIPLKGWVENLDRSEFELFGYYTGTKRDRETVRAAKAFDKFIHQPLSVQQWCEKIAQDKLHVLIFPEFGMDSMTVQLGSLRLAPIQMTSWGHPETSGMPTIDYYLSSELMEPANAVEQYTEKLVRLPNLSIHYQPLTIKTEAVSKKDIGIADDEIMFWCCQSLYKYLPQHDDVFPRIARELERAKFVFIKDHRGEYVTDIFEQRLNRAFEQYGLNYQDHCLFLPSLSNGAFAATTAIADIFLDSIGWSGCNSSMETIAHNIPIITLPGELMRGRHTMAILKMMGVEETITASKEEYIKLAVHLGKDRAYRQQISRKIAANKHKLYGDLAPVRALEDFLLGVVGKSRNSDTAQVAKNFQLAQKYHQTNRLAKAKQEYQKVLAVQSDHAEAIYGLGILAQQEGNLEQAEQLLQRAVEVQPNFLKAWFSLGNLYQSQRKFTAAEQAYRQAIALRPNSVPIYNNLGYALQEQGKWSQAIACYQTALELEPNCTEADVNWGNALFARGQLSPEKQVHYAELNCRLGLARHQASDYPTAEIYYRQAIAMQPDLEAAHYYLGLALQEQRQLPEAIASYQQVLKLNLDCGEAFYNLGKIYQDLGNLERATANFQPGLKLINPQYAAALDSDLDSATFAENYTIPQVPQGEITIGGHQFPVIPPVSEAPSERPFWSVVIPVVNRPEYFSECLASVLSQWTGAADMEIIVLDNGSTPPQWKIPNDLGKGIIRYYRFPKTVSLQENWNTAVALSRGHWIHLLHHDDYVLPGFYARLQGSLSTCPESVGAAFTGYENINEQRQVIFSQQHGLANYRGIVPDWLLRIGVSCPLSPPSVVIKRSAYERWGGYKLDLPYTCDWEFYKRVATFSDWWYEPGIFAHYRQIANSITMAENMNGSSGEAHRRAIEIADCYIPAEHRQAIAAKSRAFHFNWCLEMANIPLKVGNLQGADSLIREALKLDNSPEAMAKLNRWLEQPRATALSEYLSQNIPKSPIP